MAVSTMVSIAKNKKNKKQKKTDYAISYFFLFFVKSRKQINRAICKELMLSRLYIFVKTFFVYSNLRCDLLN